MSSEKLHRLPPSFVPEDDACSAVLPQYSPMTSAPPSYASHESDASSNLYASTSAVSISVSSRDCKFLVCADVRAHSRALPPYSVLSSIYTGWSSSVKACCFLKRSFTGSHKRPLGCATSHGSFRQEASVQRRAARRTRNRSALQQPRNSFGGQCGTLYLKWRWTWLFPCGTVFICDRGEETSSTERICSPRAVIK